MHCSKCVFCRSALRVWCPILRAYVGLEELFYNHKWYHDSCPVDAERRALLTEQLEGDKGDG